jgi:hypothetical protein
MQTAENKGRCVLSSVLTRCLLLMGPQCDEIHPQCGNCKKHGVVCDFEDPNALGSPLTQTTPTLSSESPAIKPLSVSSPVYTGLSYQPAEDHTVLAESSTSSRLLELRLLHNYTLVTSKTLPAVYNPDLEEAWQVSVPSMAFEFHFLMDALLAVSALHLRCSHPNDQSLVRASHGYWASAISQYSSLLRDSVSASNADALFATSALITFQATASRKFPNEDGEDEDGLGQYKPPVQLFHAFQGVKFLVLQSWKWLRNSERVRPIINSQPALHLVMQPNKPMFFDSLLEGMDQELAGMDEVRCAETRQAFQHAVAYLNWSHQKPDRARILGFAATVSRKFVELVNERDPRALVITAHFFAMIKVVDNVWWLRGLPEREVDGIMTVIPQEWWGKMTWATKVIQHEGLVDEETWGSNGYSEGSPKPDEDFNEDVGSHIDIVAQMSPTMAVGGG